MRRILQTHLPGGVRVSVFGSRATGRGLKPHSDLDLLIDSLEELPTMAIADVRHALAESNLPFAVDLLDRHDVGAEFLVRIEAEGLIELLSPPRQAHAAERPQPAQKSSEA